MASPWPNSFSTQIHEQKTTIQFGVGSPSEQSSTVSSNLYPRLAILKTAKGENG